MQFIGYAGILQGFGQAQAVASVIAQCLPDEKGGRLGGDVLFGGQIVPVRRVETKQIGLIGVGHEGTGERHTAHGAVPHHTGIHPAGQPLYGVCGLRIAVIAIYRAIAAEHAARRKAHGNDLFPGTKLAAVQHTQGALHIGDGVVTVIRQKAVAQDGGVIACLMKIPCHIGAFAAGAPAETAAVGHQDGGGVLISCGGGNVHQVRFALQRVPVIPARCALRPERCLDNGQWNEEYYTEGIYVGYRYFDTFGVEPFYPFGYGQGYTTFAQRVEAAMADAHRVQLRVAVTNTGTLPGREVVQVYGSAPFYTLEKPWQVLAAFAKTPALAPGETRTVELEFPLTRLQSYDPNRAAYLLEAGRYTIRVGHDSRTTVPALYIELDGDAVTRCVRNICPLDCALPLLSRKDAPAWQESVLSHVPVVHLAAAEVPTEKVTYAGTPDPLPVPSTDHAITMQDVREGRWTLEQLVAQLTVEEMADLCVGTAREGQAGADNIIGSAALTVPGAAGDTSVRLAYRGVTNMVNADGPAGLRLAPHFRVTAQGKILAPDKAFSEYAVEFAPLQPGETDYYQYCTAIPVASLLACSWDLALLEDMGDLVGDEMSQYGIRVWLAPGMNIHRDPLCGRNFEYFSEDPLLSGLCAAADVRGMQRHPKAGACIKHFFANNQEDNRMSVNEHIGEQALREIYLRNFAETIAAGDPECLMTSYNLVNGIHTANSYDAITAFAREESGFSGYVMTDWSTSSARITAQVSRPDAYYPCASSAECIRAGNDLQMPGTQENIDDIVDAVQNGTLPLGYLQRCALRILRAL